MSLEKQLKREPMKKDVCCINISTQINYMRSVLSEVPYEQLFEGIVGNDEFLITEEKSGNIVPVTRDYLLNSNNWVSNELILRVYENTVSILDDPDAIYKAGKDIFRTGVSLRFVLIRLVGVQTIINRLPNENAKFNRNKTIEIVENRNGYSIVRLHWKKDAALNKHSCEMDRGVYEGLGILTRNPASVEQKICQFEGGDYCEFHIKWKAKPFYSRFIDLFRYWFSRDIVDELEQKIEEINDIRINQDRIIELRTNELKETQAKLLEAEKRSLEHRITGGFAHEMRNALAGAQLEFKTTLNYKDKGKPSAEVLKDSATSLLKNISLIHEEHGIPREKIANLLIPKLKTIAEIADHLSDVHSGVSSDLDRGLTITSQIRDYAKMSELKRGYDRVDLMALLRGYRDRYSRDFERYKITYSVEGPDALVVSADEIHMNSIFTNLINNARDALIEQGAESKEIRVMVEERDKQVVVKIQDNGPGIPEEDLDEIFEPFFSTKPTSGTGLGLGIVKRLVQLYGGGIDVESKVNEETTFRVTLPLVS